MTQFPNVLLLEFGQFQQPTNQPNQYNQNYQQQTPQQNYSNTNSNIQKPNPNQVNPNTNTNTIDNTLTNKTNQLNLGSNIQQGNPITNKFNVLSDDDIAKLGKQKLLQLGINSLPIVFNSPEYKKLLPEIEECFLYANQELIWDEWKNIKISQQNLKLIKWYLSNVNQQ